VYENALVHRIRKSTDLIVAQQYPIKVIYDDVVVGEFFADLLVAERVLVELKSVSVLMPEHSAQALNYLRATGLEVCLLINFGRSKVEIKRLLPYTDWKEKTI
jgi:GxxExxY protein